LLKVALGNLTEAGEELGTLRASACVAPALEPRKSSEKEV